MVTEVLGNGRKEMLISYMVTQLWVLIYPLLKVHSSPNVSSALLQLDQELSCQVFITPQCM